MATSAEPLEGLHCTVPTTCKSPYTCLHPSQKNFTTKSIYKFAKFYLAWENSQHFATVVRGVGGGGGGLLLTTGFPRKWHLRNECRNSEINSILMIDASLPRSGQCLWLVVQSGNFPSARQKCYSDLHQYGISALVFQTPPELSFLFSFLRQCQLLLHWSLINVNDFNFASSGYHHWAIFWLLCATNCICWWSSKICHS